jgi:hypothetical protein
MANTIKPLISGTVILLAAALAGCVSGGPAGGGRPVAAAPSGVEGTWMDSTGGVSTLSGGVFQTVASDTGEKLSEGSYAQTSANAVSIKGISLARQRRNLPAEVAFNCLLVDPNQLNCTTSSGQNLVLRRRGAA